VTAPSTNYGPPPSYTPSTGSASYYYPPPSNTPHTSYGTPSHYYPPTSHATVEAVDVQKGHDSFISKLLKKFDLVLVLKVLLKLLIFKKIVKFIGIICLLLFIPTIKKKFGELASGMNDDEERNLNILDLNGKTLNKLI
jgi:hypothetical protein